MASFAPIDRPVCLAAAGRPDANPPEGLATWTGPTPATWPTSGPLVAPVHSTLRADPNPHPTSELGPSLLERGDGLGRSPWPVHIAGPSRSESRWGVLFCSPDFLPGTLLLEEWSSAGPLRSPWKPGVVPGYFSRHFGHRHALQSSSLRRLTGVKRSASGRLSGRQRPYADNVFVDAERLRPGDGAPASVSRTTSPLRGTRYASSFSIPCAYTPQV